MRIGNLGNESLRALQAGQQSTERIFAKLASGRRITQAADDAAGLAISQRLSAAIASLDQGVRNLSDGISLAQVAEGGLEQSSQLLGRMRELSVQAQNGTLSDADRSVIQQEFDQLSSELDRISGSTAFNGQTLLDGSAQDIAFVDGTGSENTTLSIGDQSAAALGVSGLDVANPSSIGAIDAAIDAVSSARANLGATTNRLGSQIESLRGASEATAAAESRIADADFAQLAADRMRQQILGEAQTAVLGQANLQRGRVLDLLG